MGCAGAAFRGDVVPEAEAEAALAELCAALLAVAGAGAEAVMLLIRSLVRATVGGVGAVDRGVEVEVGARKMGRVAARCRGGHRGWQRDRPDRGAEMATRQKSGGETRALPRRCEKGVERQKKLRGEEKLQRHEPQLWPSLRGRGRCCRSASGHDLLKPERCVR